ncbi:hypothetical protein HY58_04575 [Flavihumibacter sp. ZG627]|nr:hypothetical protein HY58_04575 [Flavihumibacter sp. ZG627]
MKKHVKCGIVILAAGASRRLGEPKQLLSYRGKTLISTAVETAMATGLEPLIVVLGAQIDSLISELEPYDLKIVVNKHWREGMSSSLRIGLEAAMKEGEIEAIIFMVCDQPFVTPELLLELLERTSDESKLCVASKYGEVRGTPALFRKQLFPALFTLKGDAGARKLMEQYETQVELVDFPLGIIDIDTKNDSETFLKE